MFIIILIIKFLFLLTCALTLFPTEPQAPRDFSIRYLALVTAASRVEPQNIFFLSEWMSK